MIIWLFTTCFCFSAQQIVAEVINHLRDKLGKQDRHQVQLTILSNHLDSPIFGDPVSLDSDYAVESIFKELHRVLQSRTGLPLDETFFIHATVTDLGPATVGANAKKRPRLQVWNTELFKHTLPVPYLERPDKFQDCCLILAITLALAYNRELVAVQDRETMGAPVTKDWKILRYITTRSEKLSGQLRQAKARLILLARKLCREKKLRAKDFRLCSLDESLDPLMEKMKINLNIFSDEGCFQRKYFYPHQFNPLLPTVDLLIVKEEELDRPLFHCGVITRRRKFFNSRGKMLCLSCRTIYSMNNVHRHQCNAHSVCSACRRRTLGKHDHRDFFVLRETCHETGKATCPRCNTKCNGPQCLKAHLYVCKNRLDKCGRCGRMYRKSNRLTHSCELTSYCRGCGERFKQGEPHCCQMARPKPSKIVSKLAVWDTGEAL